MPDRLLSAEIVDVERVELRAGSILEEGGPILALTLLDPMPVDTEGTAIDDLAQNLDAIRIPDGLLNVQRLGGEA